MEWNEPHTARTGTNLNLTCTGNLARAIVMINPKGKGRKRLGMEINTTSTTILAGGFSLYYYSGSGRVTW
jgi:hypothetical protein